MRRGEWMRVRIPRADFDVMLKAGEHVGLSGRTVRSVPIEKLLATQWMVQTRVVRKYIRAREYDDIHVVKIGDRYVVQDGHHRVTALVLQGFTEISALVYEPKPPEVTA